MTFIYLFLRKMF